jgi:hypothetical protein
MAARLCGAGRREVFLYRFVPAPLVGLAVALLMFVLLHVWPYKPDIGYRK